MVKGSLTARLTRRADAKAGHSDPTVESGIAEAQRIKATPGITGLSLPSVHSDGEVWHLDVGSSPPGAVLGPKGWAGRPFKRPAGWGQAGGGGGAPPVSSPPSGGLFEVPRVGVFPL